MHGVGAAPKGPARPKEHLGVGEEDQEGVGAAPKESARPKKLAPAKVDRGPKRTLGPNDAYSPNVSSPSNTCGLKLKSGGTGELANRF